MSSSAWIRLNNFKLPLSLRLKCILARVFRYGGIRPRYKCGANSVYVEVEFSGEKIDMVLEHWKGLIREWAKQNKISI